MAAAEPTPSMLIADIQRQMAQIRSDMHQEVQGAVRTAQSLTDWQAMIKSRPWLSLSVAAAVGYLLVPRRHTPAPTIVAMTTPSPMMTAAATPDTPPKSSSWRLVGTALSLVAPIAVRAAQNYALGYVEAWLAQNPLPGSPGRPPADGAREPGRSANEGTGSRMREYR